MPSPPGARRRCKGALNALQRHPWSQVPQRRQHRNTECTSIPPRRSSRAWSHACQAPCRGYRPRPWRHYFETVGGRGFHGRRQPDIVPTFPIGDRASSGAVLGVCAVEAVGGPRAATARDGPWGRGHLALVMRRKAHWFEGGAMRACRRERGQDALAPRARRWSKSLADPPAVSTAQAPRCVSASVWSPFSNLQQGTWYERDRGSSGSSRVRGTPIDSGGQRPATGRPAPVPFRSAMPRRAWQRSKQGKVDRCVSSPSILV